MKNCPELQFVKKKKKKARRLKIHADSFTALHMRAAAIQYTAASGWRTTRSGSSEGEKKNVLFNKSAEITLISQPQDNDESSAARKKKREV